MLVATAFADESAAIHPGSAYGMNLRFRRAATHLVSLLVAAGAIAMGGCVVQSAAKAEAGSASRALRSSTVEQKRSGGSSYAAQFDQLADRFAEVYPSFPYKRVDWSAQRAA